MRANTEHDDVVDALESFTEVREARVISTGEGPSARRVAFLVSRTGEISLPALRRWLRENMPKVPIPEEFVVVATLPENGAAASLVEGMARRGQGPLYLKPRNAIEAYLVRVWGESLPAARIGVLDDFFVLGGHSLLAARILHAIERDLHVSIGFDLMRRTSVLAELANILIEAGAKTTFDV